MSITSRGMKDQFECWKFIQVTSITDSHETMLLAGVSQKATEDWTHNLG